MCTIPCLALSGVAPCCWKSSRGVGDVESRDQDGVPSSKLPALPLTLDTHQSYFWERQSKQKMVGKNDKPFFAAYTPGLLWDVMCSACVNLNVYSIFSVYNISRFRTQTFQAALHCVCWREWGEDHKRHHSPACSRQTLWRSARAYPTLTLLTEKKADHLRNTVNISYITARKSYMRNILLFP